MYYKNEFTERKEARMKRRRNIQRAKTLFVTLLIFLLLIALTITAQENKELKKQVSDMTIILSAEKEVAPIRGDMRTEETYPYLGKFKIYHYCPCVKCTGKSNGITSTGTKAVEGQTIAVDPDVIPIGSTVLIDGTEYIAEDTGEGIKGNRIDMFVSDHERALQLGVKETDVYLKK